MYDVTPLQFFTVLILALFIMGVFHIVYKSHSSTHNGRHSSGSSSDHGGGSDSCDSGSSSCGGGGDGGGD